jgi:hypothetical protein
MNRISTTLAATAIALAGLALAAEDFQPLMSTTQTTWPDKHHIGVICDYEANRDQVAALAMAAGDGSLITVADTRRTEQAGAAAGLLADHKADFVVLMPRDRYFRDGTFGASVAVNRLALRGVPAIGTTAVALKQGATFSVGDGTDGQLLVNDKVPGTIDVLLPSQTTINQKSSLVIQRHGSAGISVVGLN